MADSKITALGSIGTGTDPANDQLVIVDVSDVLPTGMATTGTTKRVGLNQLLSSSPTATGAFSVTGLVTAGSATITGAATVGTTLGVTGASTLASATITGALTVSGAANFNGGATAGYLNSSLFFGSSGGFLNLYSAATGFNLKDNTGAFNIINTTNAGVFTFGDGAGSTRMTLNSTGLGIGVSPVYKLDVRTAPATAAIEGSRISDATRTMISGQTGATYSYLGIGANQNVIYTSSGRLDIVADTQSLFLRTGTNNYLHLDATGNVGIGVTPSASWVTYKALEFDTGIVSGSSSMALNRNCYFDGVNWRYKVTTSFGIAQYQLSGNGNHIWNIASSGSAGAAINGGTGAWTQAMTLDANGNLILLSSNTPSTLTTNGQLTVNATSNTNLRFSYRGSDGVTRTANLTLA